MATITNPITAQSSLTTPTATATGATGLTSSDFMNLMIQQLQNQDPLNPTDSNQLLQQISQISTLQSNQTLQTSLSALTLQQSIGAAGNLIGKAVKGYDPNGNPLTGNVTAVQVQNQQVFLQLDSSATLLPMANVSNIALPAATSASNSNALSSLMTALGLG